MRCRPDRRFFITRPMFSGIDVAKAVRLTNDCRRSAADCLRSDHADEKIVLKGIVAREDAKPPASTR